MIKKTSLLALVICLFLVLLSPSLVQAKNELVILDSSAQVEFPFRLTFNLSAQSDVNITDIRLCYTVDRMSYVQVTSEAYIEFEPAATVSVSWTWDMRKAGGLPPGSSVEYWWKVEDANGDIIKTAPIQVQFDDTRYPWRSLTKGKVTIYWYEGDESFAQELMISAHQALARLAENTGAYLEKPVRLYIYANFQDLQGAMIYPREWTGGVAFTRYGIIAIGIAPVDLAWGKRAIAHELAHLVIHQMTFNPYSGLPTWLNEGLAMYAEEVLSPGYTACLNRAIAENSLISVRSLSSPFSAYAEESILAYAQSYSLVEFLINNYGLGKMLELLNTFRQGSSYDGALDKVYGFDMDGLDTLWREYVTVPVQPTEEGVPQALIGTLAGLATAFLLVLSLTIENWAWRRGW
ncbi:MAG: peptidase MA family metallohydrolase [Dehalococcoidales bacterium]|nr:peptidase MA family metallohydrolase [Dehalococcoidales bacterium]